MKFHHYGLVSSNAAASCQLLEDLGYRVSPAVHDPLQNVHLYWAEHPTLPCVEIIAPTDTPGPVSGLAKRLKQGIYHLCFEVEDVAACLAQFGAHNQVMTVSEPKPAVLFEHRKVSFYYVENLGLIELVEAAERPAA
jgi:methylmalonyl-CoA/ethylmalonyl-CoA epimerase